MAAHAALTESLAQPSLEQEKADNNNNVIGDRLGAKFHPSVKVSLVL